MTVPIRVKRSEGGKEKRCQICIIARRLNRFTRPE